MFKIVPMSHELLSKFEFRDLDKSILKSNPHVSDFLTMYFCSHGEAMLSDINGEQDYILGMWCIIEGELSLFFSKRLFEIKRKTIIKMMKHVFFNYVSAGYDELRASILCDNETNIKFAGIFNFTPTNERVNILGDIYTTWRWTRCLL